MNTPARPAALRIVIGEPGQEQRGFDPATPNTARVYNSWLGGKDNYAADRGEASALVEIYPPLLDLVRENRNFLRQAVTWAAGEGISQFVDLGAGLPAEPNTHQAARAVNPDAKVAYVDYDPVVLAHARALLATRPGVAAVAADLTDPAAVLACAELREIIDLTQPVCVILGAVLHFLDADAARRVTAGYRDLVAPGSCLIISLARYDDEELARQLAEKYTAGQFVNHTTGDIASFFAGWQLAGPGLTEASAWRSRADRPMVLAHRAGHVIVGAAGLPATAGDR